VGGHFAGQPLAHGGEPRLSLKAVEGWSGLFGGARADLHFVVTARRPFRGRVGWSLAYEQRALLRRESALAVDPGKDERVRIRLDVPAVKEGVVMPLTLSIALSAPGAEVAEASLEKRLWVFPRDPFAGRRAWLRTLSIHLFDPEETTGPVLKAMEVPYAETTNPESMRALERGLIVIGEGVSFDDYRGLPEIVCQAAARGVPVLCLAPSGGDFPIPGTEAVDLPAPSRIVLRRLDVIAELDKRLDATAWPPDGRVLASSLAVTGERRIVAARVAEDEKGWPWLEVRCAAKRGKLIVCGFGIIGKWEAGPTPRFLFARLLEYLNADDREGRE